MMKTIEIHTGSRTEMVNIDHQVQTAIRESGVSEGLGVIWVPHTTAAVTVNENADPSVVRDILETLNRQIPFDAHYQHREGNAAAHIKSSLFGVSLQFIIHQGKPLFGTWQSFFFCEFDGPRTRRIVVKIIEG